jgi:HEPN domain-containing protein
MASKRKSEAQRWYHQAVFDLQAAVWNFQGKFYNTTCFLSQQAAEKALKSILYYTGARKKALLTNSVVTMIQSVTSLVPELFDTLEEARQLDLHYIPARYPDGLPDGIPHLFYGETLASQALQAAEKILSATTAYYSSKEDASFFETRELAENISSGEGSSG